MRIAFDMDGTITEGRFLEPPRTRDMYMGLAPYDGDMREVLRHICQQHEVFIITARSDYRADIMIQDWLEMERVLDAFPDDNTRVTAILTNPHQGHKNPENGIWKANLIEALGCELVFDDSVHVYNNCYLHMPTYLVDNPNWPENQVDQYGRVKSWKEIGAIVEEYNNRITHSRETSI